MSTPTPDEIRDSIANDLYTGDAERQVADKRVRKFSPAERIAGLQELESDRSASGPFVRIGFKKRGF